MNDTPSAKCACQHCGLHLEFPGELDGSTIECPTCQQTTLLSIPAAAEPSEELTPAAIASALSSRVPKTPVSFLYQFGLLFVTLAMVLLPVLYLALIAAAGYGVYYWGTHFSSLLTSGVGGARIFLLKAALYIAPFLAGVVVVLFMVKPLFARRPKHAQPLALNPGAEPLLFTYITQICESVGAPAPRRIDLDCQLNASASFRRGAWSLLGNDLVLTIGLPLVAGLNTRQFAGVIAHEFGHFTQGFGMRLTYVIRSVNAWFARVVYERDAWDVSLEEWAEEAQDGRVAIVIAFIRFSVWCSRLVLKLLMYLGHGIGCFMLRQMEYDADSYQIKLVGSEGFEATSKRLHVLGSLLDRTYKDLRPSWNMSHKLPDNFPAWLMRHDAELRANQRTHLEDTLGLEASGLFDTHPSWGDRIRRARQANESGVFHLEQPATKLFACFEVPAKQVTILHYTDDLGIPAPMINLVPVSHAASADANFQESPPPTPTAPRIRVKLSTPPPS
ncbi:MAG: M48 family metalloprotease [Verrucomicrobia bacterium]|nr:M48 family metalloprotease [Verrucomicrobiota bacterium]